MDATLIPHPMIPHRLADPMGTQDTLTDSCDPPPPVVRLRGPKAGHFFCEIPVHGFLELLLEPRHSTRFLQKKGICESETDAKTT